MSKDTYRHFLEGAALRPCRDALNRAGYEVEIQGGCLVFVHPHFHLDPRRHRFCGLLRVLGGADLESRR